MIDPPKNHLLRFLRARPRAVGEAFRTNPRHESRRKARLSWDVGKETRLVPARLVDISRVGAAVITNTPPAVLTPVRIRLVGSTPTPWIEAHVLGIEPTDGIYRVRIQFREPCPTIMLKSAVLSSMVQGIPADRSSQAAESDASL
jgi:hypothetical protein